MSIDHVGDFESIRPHHDDEIQRQLQSLVRDKKFIRAACEFVLHPYHKLLSPVFGPIFKLVLSRRVRNIDNIQELHNHLRPFVEKVIESTTSGYSFAGDEHVPKNGGCILISNHRDIALDPAFVNYAIHLMKLPPLEIGIGDNLLHEGFEATFMRINGGFAIPRSEKSLRQQYVALDRTSRYVRYAVERGQRIWLAQRAGRAKDGVDQTDPAVLKMLKLAYRKEDASLSQWLERVPLVPVTLTYELDPCAPLKAQELQETEESGGYEKADREDLHSIVAGLRGFKGRIHVEFSPRIRGEFKNETELAKRVDELMSSKRQKFPTFAEAHRRLHGVPNDVSLPPRIQAALEEQLAQCESPATKNLTLSQYANQYG